MEDFVLVEDYAKDASPIKGYRVGDILFVRRSMGFDREIYHHACIVTKVDQSGGFLEGYDFDPSLGESFSAISLVRKTTGYYKGKPRKLLVDDFKKLFKERGKDHVVHARGPEDPSELWEMMFRLESLKEKELTYDILRYNCQHFSYFVRYGKEESPEVKLLQNSLSKAIEGWKDTKNSFWLGKLGPLVAVLGGVAQGGSFYLENVRQEEVVEDTENEYEYEYEEVKTGYEEWDESELTKCRALADWQGQKEDDLSFVCGDVIIVYDNHTDPNGWWWGELNGIVGTFPSNYVIRLENGKKEEVESDSPVETLNVYPSSGENGSYTQMAIDGYSTDGNHVYYPTQNVHGLNSYVPMKQEEVPLNSVYYPSPNNLSVNCVASPSSSRKQGVSVSQNSNLYPQNRNSFNYVSPPYLQQDVSVAQKNNLYPAQNRNSFNYVSPPYLQHDVLGSQNNLQHSSSNGIDKVVSMKQEEVPVNSVYYPPQNRSSSNFVVPPNLQQNVLVTQSNLQYPQNRNSVNGLSNSQSYVPSPLASRKAVPVPQSNLQYPPQNRNSVNGLSNSQSYVPSPLASRKPVLEPEVVVNSPVPTALNSVRTGTATKEEIVESSGGFFKPVDISSCK